jgi:hypothetical protein
MLALTYANGYLLHYDAREKQEDLALVYARHAVAAEPSNPLAYYALSVSHIVRKDIAAFLSASERALALNPLDGAIMGEVALWMSYSGHWQRGRELMERAMVLNPRIRASSGIPASMTPTVRRTIHGPSTTHCA